MSRFAEISKIRSGIVFSDPCYDESVWCQYRNHMSASDWMMSQESKCSGDGYHDFEIKIGRPTVLGQVKFEEKDDGLLISFPAHYEINHFELGMDTACIFCGNLDNFDQFGREAAIHTGSDGLFADLYEFKVKGEDKPIGFVLLGSVDSDLVDELSLFQSFTAGFDGKEVSRDEFEKRISESNLDYIKLRNHELASSKLHEISQNKKPDIEPEH